jgi:GTP-binding protein
MKPRFVVLAGRTNVGKSTLFNRLVGKPQAIISEEPGTTRDRNQGLVEWQGKTFWLMDTPGFDVPPKDEVARASLKQMEQALKEAAVVLFVVDGQVGVTPAERGFITRYRKAAPHSILVVNKLDSLTKRTQAEGISLGFKDIALTSAKTGSGLGDLLELVIPHLSSEPAPQPKLRLALLGQTNVGKSSLFNRFLGHERSIVLATPHTTRDKVHGYIEDQDVAVEVVDTAGIRRQLKKSPRLEQQSVAQSIQSLTEVNVAALVVDGSQPPSWQDQRLGDTVAEAGIGCLVLMNKADLVPFDQRKAALQRITRALTMLPFAKHLWVSAKSGEGTDKVVPEAESALKAWSTTLTQGELDQFSAFLRRNKATRNLPISGFTQASTNPPRFLLHLKTKENLPVAMKGWIERKLRERYHLEGTPLTVRLKGLRKG